VIFAVLYLLLIQHQILA